MLRFEWDENKNKENQAKHKISFETAKYVFDDMHYIEMYDFEHSTADEDRYIMIKESIMTENEKVTEDQLREIEEAKKYPIVFDEDCPELSPAMMKAFRCAVVQRNRQAQGPW